MKIAVIGGGMGGLVAAGLLARDGHSVDLFEGSRVLGGKARSVSDRGLTLDTGPTLLTLPHVVRETFAQLDALDLLPALHPLAVHCDYRFAGGGRFIAGENIEAMAEQAAAFGPKEAKGVRSFYKEAETLWRVAGEPYLEAPYDGLDSFFGRVLRRGAFAVAKGMRMGTLASLAEKHFKSPQMRQYVGRFATYVGASPYDVSAAFAQIPHVERVFGVHHVEGGMGSLANGLVRAVSRLGVKLFTNMLSRYERRGDTFVVASEGFEEAYDTLVVNADPLRHYQREHEPLSLSGYVLLLRVKKKISLPHHNILFSPDYPQEMQDIFSGKWPSDPTVYVCNPSATDQGMAPPGECGLFVMLNAPVLPKAFDPEHDQTQVRLARGQCLTAVTRAYPELEGHIEVIGERTPLDFAAIGSPRGSLYGYLPKGTLGAFKRPAMRAGKGLYFVGGGTHPGGGVPMVMLSGRFAREMVQAHV